ncbi:MAG TPA: galactose-1-phosphate uridylyltransferase [Syntrophorhabdaceae bacterium]|jgi:UDPglucose--hexose-1-phosphate uridylyltransferase|nr:galactose-1-phosphate uridylyltransferase [Syntrophorhabdaceae bacterium]HQM76820.1 galactose-1-phosphate uridylyltransferase [Syntrophorhabdaceae bacterium]
MSEVRYNIITGDWVVIATERAKRPEDFSQVKQKDVLPEYVSHCPFCTGHEDNTPPETFRLTDDEGKWIVRSVPNKFSAFDREGEVVKQRVGLRQFITGVGLHEVIIETPKHNMTTALLPVDHVKQILYVYKHRLAAFYEDNRIEHVIIFKNHGQGAGTSLEHPHSQIVGTPVFPGQVMTRLEEAIRNYYYLNFGECVYCLCLKNELEDKVRLISENKSFVAFIPYAALSPFHLWIFPRRHVACFCDITEEEISDLASILKEVLLRLYVGLDDPNYNYMVRSLSPKETNSKFFHWYIAVVPRVSQTAGFELGTGMFINTSSPESSAQFLKDVKI